MTVWAGCRFFKYRVLIICIQPIQSFCLMISLYLKKQKRLAEGRKNTARDELYLKLAEDFLYGEFAAALDVEKGEVEDLIGRRVREMEMCL